MKKGDSEIQRRLFSLRDEKYAAFQAKIVPGIAVGSIIGVRTPELRKIAGDMRKSGEHAEFLLELPHRYFEENQLHSFILSLEKDFGECVIRVERFLPFVDNWATCDQLCPKVFARHKAELVPLVKRWLVSGALYTQRFAIGMLMRHFLDGDFDDCYLEMVAELRSDEYYLNMMRAWFFATALAKQWDSAVRFIEDGKLDQWTHNKSIQKAIESFRVSDERKEYLRALRKIRQ